MIRCMGFFGIHSVEFLRPAKEEGKPYEFFVGSHLLKVSWWAKLLMTRRRGL
jgi:hypothetical protein